MYAIRSYYVKSGLFELYIKGGIAVNHMINNEGQGMPEQEIEVKSSAPKAVYIHIPFCTNKFV